MNFKLLLAGLILSTLSCAGVYADDHDSARKAGKAVISPTGTYKYVSRADGDLFLDYYAPAPESDTQYNGKTKPTILFVFGGGFCKGTRDAQVYLPYFKKMTEMGYPVVSIDYRLGMKNATHGGGLGSFRAMQRSVNIAVEDLYAATDFLLVNGRSIGVDANNVVLCGSSAGALIVSHAAWEIDKKSGMASVLPANYKYKGVMVYSGGILSGNWTPKFSSELCPELIMHGTEDKTVKYNQIWFFAIHFCGGNKITSLLDKAGVRHMTYRYEGNRHEICEIQRKTVDIQDFFIKAMVMDGKNFKVDAKVVDPSIKKWAPKPTTALYGKKK